MPASRFIRYCLLTIMTALVVAGCASIYTTDYDALYGPAEIKDRTIGWSEFQGRVDKGHVSFIKDVKPILDSRCVACHACNDAPCQQKLTSYEGIDRGANKELVYDGGRLTAMEPTRLFIDAKSTEKWREKGFYPILNERIENAEADLMGSLLFRVLNQKFINPLSDHGGSPQPLPETFDLSLNRNQQCPTIEEFDYYEEKNPLWGMPFGLPGLNVQELSTINQWLYEGAKFEPPAPFSNESQNAARKWEKFFNGSSLKQQLVSRYLYEHLFLGHLHFKNSPDREFFKLVRSYTPPGEEIDEVPTVRPYDDPDTDRVYYRLRPIKATIVDKTHLVYELSDKRMARFKQLFLEPDYKVESLPSYEPKVASNPFRSFAAIPAKSKYTFLLDEAQFFIGGFIKGPVCRGQISLNVIDDHFWAMFLDPDKDPVSHDSVFLAQQAKNLRLPAAKEDTLNPTNIWFRFAQAQKRYRQAKNDYLDKRYQNSVENSLGSIWNGRNDNLKDAAGNPIPNDNAALTIFRHFDSATVVKGFEGGEPKTVWIIDYPIFERIHYLLVAGFNVYGNVGHQLSTRLYMDYLRMESENNFLDFLPSDQRKPMRDSWYRGVGTNIISYFDNPLTGTERESRVRYQTKEYKTELLGYIENQFAGLDLTDPINRCMGDGNINACSAGETSDLEKRIFPHMQQLASITGHTLKPIPDLAYLKVISSRADEKAVSYSLIHNRAHTNISYLFNEDSRLEPENDTLTVIPGYIGSYPNFYYQVNEAQLADFIVQLTSIKTAEDEDRFIRSYGIRRTDTRFWAFNDWLNKDYMRQAPITAGWFDLNRYENK
ncbi:fatty acid cis/trans isomerase [Alkalimarinus coralli]|uniref:fatty acid cis/trans isomerase n=1 Tax=Alkalimarinus coralli TaxID=2935863 RepID=UPI00202BA2FE|nr:fatty acid cis/trans isomerase [Alkalimarinus coralli]